MNAASKLFEYLSEVTVAVDVLLLMTVLQLVVLDVEPKSLHDAGPCLRVHAQQAGQPRVQFVLRRLGRKIRRSNGAVKVSSGKCRHCHATAGRAHGRYLVVEHEQKGALHIHVAGPLDLEAIRLLGGGHSVPLKGETAYNDENFIQTATCLVQGWF